MRQSITTCMLLAAFATFGVKICAGKKKAIFWSGTDIEKCNQTTWTDEEWKLASKRYNMDVSHFWGDPCISGQANRGFVWLPALDKNYCLVFSEKEDCPGSDGYMEGETQDLTLSGMSALSPVHYPALSDAGRS